MNHLAVTFLLSSLLLLKATADANTRIVGGEVVSRSTEYPSFASFRARRQEGGKMKTTFCGGTLISPDILLTAAHCIRRSSIVSISVTFGLVDLEDDNTYTTIDAESWTIHPGFDPESNVGSGDDIGYIRLSKPMTDVDPIDLKFDDGFPETSSSVVAVGFGYTNDEGPLSQKLREVTLQVRSASSSRCRFSFKFDNADQICAGGNGKGGCMGDSGGPAYQDGYLAGLTSFGGNTCGESPTVYTRISAYEDWLRGEVCTGEPGLPDWCNDDGGRGGIGGNDFVPAPPPSEAISGGGVACFAGSNMVIVADSDNGNVNTRSIRMDQLQLGDFVHVGYGEYEPVYSFGHLSNTKLADFVQVTTEQSSLRLTHDHMVFEKYHGAVPASMLRVDNVLLNDGSEDRIVSITTVHERGVYAPFTPSGKIVVNGILASSYIAMQEQELELFGIPLSHQWLGQAMQFPQRSLCYHTTHFCPAETYTTDGISQSVLRPLHIATWLLQQIGGLRIFLIFLLAMVATILTILEALIVHPILLVGTVLFVALRQSSSYRLTMKEA